MNQTTQRGGAEIIDLAALKERRIMQRSLDDYRSYLQSLALAQMETEAQYLLEEFSGQNFGPDYLQKVQLLLGEISNRADGTFASAINRIRGQLPTQLSQSLNPLQ